MELNKMVYTIITLSVVVISVAAIMMPVLADATETHVTLENDGLIYMNKYGTSAELTLEWDHTDPSNITVGTETIALPGDTAYALTTIGNNSFFIRYLVQNSVSYLQVYDDSSSASIAANTSDGTDMTIAISNGTVTATVGDNSETYTYDDYVFVVAEDGDYVMKDSTDSVYMTGDSEIYAYGRSAIAFTSGTWQVNFAIEGTIDDGVTITPISSSVITVDSIEITAPANSNYANVYDFEKIVFTATNTNTEETAEVTYSQVIVPAEISAELNEHLDSGTIALINAIPALVLVSLVMVAVGLSTKRDD